MPASLARVDQRVQLLQRLLDWSFPAPVSGIEVAGRAGTLYLRRPFASRAALRRRWKALTREEEEDAACCLKWDSSLTAANQGGKRSKCSSSPGSRMF